MAYYDDRRYPAPRDRARPMSYAADYRDSPRYERYERQVYPDESVEEIQRDYPPGEGYVYERGYDSRRSRRPVYENVRRASSVSGHDPYYDGYRSRARPSRDYDDRRPRRSRYSSPSPSPSPPRHRRRKSFSEQAMSAIGLGSAASRGRDRDGRGRDSSRHRRYSSDSRSRSRSRDRERKRRERSEGRISQAARAALTAGAVEAFRSRKDPGEWTGEKGKRILTAAVTAAGTDGLVDRDPNKHSKRHMVESTLAGLAATHFVNGSRSQSRGRNSRKSSSGLKDLAASGAIAAAGKEIYDRFSRSRSRARERGRSSDSDDDRRGSKKRSKSVSDYISKGMAALGLGEEGNKRSDDGRERGERRRHRDSRRRDRSDSYSDSDADSDYYHRGSSSRDPRRDRGSRDVGRYRSMDGRNSQPPYPYNNRRSVPPSASRGENGGDDAAITKAGTHSHSSSESDSDLGDSDDEKKKHKKMQRDMMLTGGLATVATVHAAHSVYGSVQKRKKRLQELEEGKITPEEARKRRMKANAMDVFSVGLAALGIKGAYGEWQEVNEKRKEHKHFQEECEERAKKRLLKRSHSQGAPKRHRWPDEIEYPPSRNGSHTYNNASMEPAQISY
ncbi:hypothetical protein N7513_011852 [Penicillium frequentans]|nr:hypothetical protein N7513_011852 [Penicillium glabrum]